MDVDDAPLESSQKFALENSHKSCQRNQVHLRRAQRLDVGPFGVVIQLRAKFAGRNELRWQAAFPRPLQHPGLRYIAQHDSNLGRDFSRGTGISNRHKVRALTRTQNSDTEFMFASHPPFLPAWRAD